MTLCNTATATEAEMLMCKPYARLTGCNGCPKLTSYLFQLWPTPALPPPLVFFHRVWTRAIYFAKSLSDSTSMDPFSVVTGSAGLVSLGITICDGLLTYCRTYKSRENDLNVLGDHCGRLQVLLQVVERRLESGTIADASFRTTMKECFAASEHSVSDVQALNGKYSSSVITVSPMRSRSKVALWKLLYPFEADRFETLRKQLNDFHAALSGLLLVMN